MTRFGDSHDSAARQKGLKGGFLSASRRDRPHIFFAPGVNRGQIIEFFRMKYQK
jgi:hypothetical protein